MEWKWCEGSSDISLLKETERYFILSLSHWSSDLPMLAWLVTLLLYRLVVGGVTKVRLHQGWYKYCCINSQKYRSNSRECTVRVERKWCERHVTSCRLLNGAVSAISWAADGSVSASCVSFSFGALRLSCCITYLTLCTRFWFFVCWVTGVEYVFGRILNTDYKIDLKRI